jgi:hypothetical protein
LDLKKSICMQTYHNIVSVITIAICSVGFFYSPDIWVDFLLACLCVAALLLNRDK